MKDPGHEEGVVTLSDGGRLAYQIHGLAHGGVPVLLVRPLGGSMALWGAFRTTLAEKLRVIAFDLRGSGRSSPDPARMTTKTIARDALQLLEHLGVPRAHVFGISLGGMAATWMGIRAPERVARLCLASAPARGIDLSHTGLRRKLSLAACFARPAEDVEPSLVDAVLSRPFRESHPDEVRAIERLVRAEPATRSALLKHALAGLLHDARKGLSRIEAHTLVLAGEHDGLLGIAPPRALADGIRRATFEVIAGSGHDLTLEQPEVTATRASSFFRA